MDPQRGQELLSVLGAVLGIGLALLILLVFSYTFLRWYRRGQRWHRERTRGVGSVAVELLPPFSISGSLGTAGSGYERFHTRGL